MKAATRKKLLEAWEYCDEHDKSTKFMLQYMQDVAGIDLDCVINFLTKHTEDDESGEIDGDVQCRMIDHDKLNLESNYQKIKSEIRRLS